MKTRWEFDVPVQGVSDRYVTMEELLRAYRSSKASDTATAQAILEYACDCGCDPAALLLAQLLMNNPAVTLGQAERYAKAEQLLRALMNDPDAPDALTARLAMELAKLCDMQNRPVGVLAMLLRARRCGSGAVPDKDLETCRRKLSRMDINSFGSNAVDAYDLGTELSRVGGPFRFAEFFLREAVDSAEGELKGQASLALADLYSENLKEGEHLWEEAQRMYAQAAALGCPEFILRKKTAPAPQMQRVKFRYA